MRNIQGEKKDNLSTLKVTREKMDVFKEKIVKEMWKNYYLYTNWSLYFSNFFQISDLSKDPAKIQKNFLWIYHSNLLVLI